MVATAVKNKLSTKDAKRTSYAELSATYDRIYDIADRLIKKHNPCNIHTKRKKSYCVEYYEDRGFNTNRLCCSGCGEFPERDKNHWSKTGCTTKCLACKLYLCPTVFRQNKRLDNQLYRLREFADKHGLPASSYFVSKEKWLKQMEEAI